LREGSRASRTPLRHFQQGGLPILAKAMQIAAMVTGAACRVGCAGARGGAPCGASGAYGGWRSGWSKSHAKKVGKAGKVGQAAMPGYASPRFVVATSTSALQSTSRNRANLGNLSDAARACHAAMRN